MVVHTKIADIEAKFNNLVINPVIRNPALRPLTYASAVMFSYVVAVYTVYYVYVVML